VSFFHLRIKTLKFSVLNEEILIEKDFSMRFI
jgi:hypothetical protein